MDQHTGRLRERKKIRFTPQTEDRHTSRQRDRQMEEQTDRETERKKKEVSRLRQNTDIQTDR